MAHIQREELTERKKKKGERNTSPKICKCKTVRINNLLLSGIIGAATLYTLAYAIDLESQITVTSSKKLRLNGYTDGVLKFTVDFIIKSPN